MADEDDAQHLVFHGRDHGHRHRAQERHPDARFGATLLRARLRIARSDLSGGAQKAAPDFDDGAGDGLRHAPAGGRRRLGRPASATAGDCGDRRRDGLDGSIAAGDADAILLIAEARTLRVSMVVAPLSLLALTRFAASASDLSGLSFAPVFVSAPLTLTYKVSAAGV